MPETFATTPEGILLMANGQDHVYAWDGQGPARKAGVEKPTEALTIAGEGVGAIVGEYTAYCRFVDLRGNPSSLSPVSNILIPESATGTITNVTGGSPVTIESPNHGLGTGAIVLINDVLGITSVNGTRWTITSTGPNSFTLDDSGIAGTYLGGGTWTAGVKKILYTDVPVPTEPNFVKRKELLRNTNGQGIVYYVDVATEDLTGTEFESELTDTDLVAQQAVPLITNTGEDLAIARYDRPPNFKRVLAYVLGRMFAAADEVYTEGSSSLTFGSKIVQGIGTEWNAVVVGRFFYPDANFTAKSFEIEAVDVALQQLTLVEEYDGATDPYARYAIRPAPGHRRQIYFTPAGLPEAWPPWQAISVPESQDGDELTTVIAWNTYLWVFERRHIHRCTFATNPTLDGQVFPAYAGRGCLHERVGVPVGPDLYLMDERGIYRFDGIAPTRVSDQIQNLFEPDDDSAYRINWNASRWFHAVDSPTHETIRFFVNIGGDYLPQFALAYCYSTEPGRWWVERYPVPIGASVAGVLNGRPVIFLGGPAGEIYALETQNLDAADPALGTVRGTASGATLYSLVDATAMFDTALKNAPLVIVDGTGRGQERLIVSATGTTLTIKDPWATLPDTTSVYQIGGIRWAYQTGWMRLPPNDRVPDQQEQVRKLEFLFTPTPNDASFDVRLYHDLADVAESQGYDFDSGSVRVREGEPDIVVQQNRSVRPNGYAKHTFGGRRDLDMDGPRFLSVGLAGAGSKDGFVLRQLLVGGAV